MARNTLIIHKGGGSCFASDKSITAVYFKVKSEELHL